MDEYHKIYGPFVRAVDGPNRNKIITGSWTMPEFEFLADVDWVFTEKINGVNIRVHWDGHKVTFGGRTDTAQLSVKMFKYLTDTFPEEIFEQAFGDTVLTLYGEGYGAGIQTGGGKYSPDPALALFDVKIDKWWLRRPDVLDVAQKVGVPVVPISATCSLSWMIDAMSATPLPSAYGNFNAEGVVGTPLVPLFARDGSRIIVKVKEADFKGVTR